MTIRQIIKEGVFVLGAFALSVILFSLLTTHTESIYISDVYISAKSTEARWYDFFLRLNFPAGLLFFFPVLFITNTIRLCYYRFSRRHLAVFHLFISFVSLIISLVLAFFMQQISWLFSGPMILYPPLSAMAEAQSSGYEIWTPVAYCFCLLHIAVLVITIRAIPRHSSEY